MTRRQVGINTVIRRGLRENALQAASFAAFTGLCCRFCPPNRAKYPLFSNKNKYLYMMAQRLL